MRLKKFVNQFLTDDRGVGSIYMLCLLPVFLMIAGLGMDGAAAFRTQEMLLSTADATALAAAQRMPVYGAASPTQTSNALSAAFNYARLNMSVAGFGNVLNTNAATNGDIVFGHWNGSTFSSPAPPDVSENAVQVTVRTATANGNPYPTSFLALIGKTSWDISATAVAINGKPVPICVLALGSFSLSGGPKTNLAGCSIAANSATDPTALSCNGHNTNADYGFSTTIDSGCGNVQLSHQPFVTDPYVNLASAIHSGGALQNTCGSYPQEAGGTNTKWSGSLSLIATQIVCGDVQLQGNVTITTPANGAVVVIENGQLDTGSFKLTASAGSTLTVVFSGTAGSYTHYPTGSGTLSFAAPSSGPFPNIALYQDPALTTGLGITGGPTWDIQGIIYLPKADLEFKGSSNSVAAGTSCIALVAHDITIKGTGYILGQGGCNNLPMTPAPISLLVQ